MLLVLGDQLAKIIVPELHFVHNASGPRRRVVVAGYFAPHAAHLVAGRDPPHGPVHTRAERRDPVVHLAAQLVVIQGVHRPLLVTQLDHLLLAVVLEGDPIVVIGRIGVDFGPLEHAGGDLGIGQGGAVDVLGGLVPRRWVHRRDRRYVPACLCVARRQVGVVGRFDSDVGIVRCRAVPVGTGGADRAGAALGLVVHHPLHFAPGGVIFQAGDHAGRIGDTLLLTRVVVLGGGDQHGVAAHRDGVWARGG